MASSPDKASRSALAVTADAATVAVSFAVLLIAAVCAALIGAELVSAAAGEHHRYWAGLPVPHDTALRVVILLGLMALFVATMALVARSRSQGLTLPVADGSLVLPERLVTDLVGRALHRHPDVVDVRSTLRVTDAGLRIDIHAAVRPGAVVATLDPELRELVASGVEAALGVRPQIRRLRLKVLEVGDLARHLRRV